MRALFAMLFVLLFNIALAAPASARTDNPGITTDSIEGNWNNLTEEQKAALAAQIAKSASGNNVDAFGGVSPRNVSAEAIEPWLTLIDKVGEGLVRLARDLGVTANELLRTPVGVIAVGLVAYHVMGAEIVGVLVGMLWFSLTFPIWILLFYKLVIPVVEYKEVLQTRRFWGPVQVTVPIRRKAGFSEDSATEWVMTLLLVLDLMITVIFIA